MNLEEIKERHSKIGGTPWKSSEYSTDYYLQGYSVKSWNDGDIANCIEELGEVDFISNAPADIAYLLSIIEQAEKAIEKLGKMDDPDKIEKFASEALKAIRGN